ncbi:ABC transporter [Beauveria brongniartii RCEF 3172]|uniref:ABC transporter n=1 Tax=Beauveria brongniartii RCEF 3172 TaxID=1081107 RepID=A0A162JIH8_9HYPO|nr:ABC transporter [Beauveria brongniartii RCEF 3172]
MEGLSKLVPTNVHSMLYFSFVILVNVGAILAGATYTAALQFLVLLYFIQRYYLRTSRQFRLLVIEAKTPLVSSLRDIGTGIAYIGASRTQKHNFVHCLYILDRSQKPYYFLLASQAFLSLTLDLVVALMALTLSILPLYVKGSTSPNAAGLAFLNLITLARLCDFLRDTPTEKRAKETARPENWPSCGEVVFQSVSARYKLDDSDQEPADLVNINLSIESGKKIGAMGRTGSGKSSLLYSILGFLEYEGTISIDGVDVKTADPDELRSRIIAITPESVELDGTVRDNLLPYDKTWGETKPGRPDAEQQKEAERRDQVVRATLIRLRIWDRLPRKRGLDAVLEEFGTHTERSNCCVSLVLVDEATASVDIWRDQIVRKMMLEYFRGCTMIVVAHREETIADTNRTVHMPNGQIEHADV